ncbi:hypothetical protein TNCV_2220961 [Trichonephila clavipes]|nr:hypothetical protein TNCV_2220961 [Trichonephila clavipes]
MILDLSNPSFNFQISITWCSSTPILLLLAHQSPPGLEVLHPKTVYDAVKLDPAGDYRQLNSPVTEFGQLPHARSLDRLCSCTTWHSAAIAFRARHIFGRHSCPNTLIAGVIFLRQL